MASVKYYREDKDTGKKEKITRRDFWLLAKKYPRGSLRYRVKLLDTRPSFELTVID